MYQSILINQLKLSLKFHKWAFNGISILLELSISVDYGKQPSAKYHIKRMIEESTLIFEEMSILLATIEGCMNSRPLTALKNDPDDLQVITPSHFVLVRSMMSLPEESILDLNPQGLPRWQLRDNF